MLSGGPAGNRGKTVNTFGQLQLPRNEKVLTLFGMAAVTGTLLRGGGVNRPCINLAGRYRPPAAGNNRLTLLRKYHANQDNHHTIFWLHR